MQPTRPLLLAGALALGALLPACFVSTEQGQAMEADIVKLKADFAKARSDSESEAQKAENERDKLRAEQDSEIKKIDAKIAEVNEALENLRRTAGKTGADLAVQLDDEEKDIARLRGQVEEFQAKAGGSPQAGTELQSRFTAIEKRLDADEKRLADDDDKLKAAQQASVVAATEKKQEEAAPTTKDGLYNFARKKLDAGDSDVARDLFTQFIAKYKKDPLAANAQYWIGESYYTQKDYRKAGLEFQKVRDLYPTSEKAPDALLKVGYAFVELNLLDDAKLFLEEVVRTYPKTPAAKLAKEKLGDLHKHAK